jgi:predicted nucleic acid-binding protein
MDYLLDTNIPSEARRAGGNPKVKTWLAGVASSSLYLSVVTIGELRKGIVQLRRRDPAAAQAIDAWLATLLATFGARVLEFDRAAAEHWGDILGGVNPVPVEDALQAAIAIRHGMTLVTRNIRHVAGIPGLLVLDPS